MKSTRLPFAKLEPFNFNENEIMCDEVCLADDNEWNGNIGGICHLISLVHIIIRYVCLNLIAPKLAATLSDQRKVLNE